MNLKKLSLDELKAMATELEVAHLVSGNKNEKQTWIKEIKRQQAALRRGYRKNLIPLESFSF